MFEPLLLEECGAQVLRGIEEGVVMSPHPAVVSSFERVSDAAAPDHAGQHPACAAWPPGSLARPGTAPLPRPAQKEEFLAVRLALEQGVSKQYMDNDLLLLCKDNPEVSCGRALQRLPARPPARPPCTEAAAAAAAAAAAE